jgi:hypothetical protein
MIKVWKWVVAILLITVIYVSWLGWDTYNKIIPEPPKGFIKINDEKTLLHTGTYSWGERGKNISVDSAGPTEIAKGVPTKFINPATNVTFSFELPPSSTKMNIWDLHTGEMTYKDISVKNPNFSKIKLPSGDYAFEVEAKWEKGEVTYVSRVQWDERKPDSPPPPVKKDGNLVITPIPFYPEQIESYIGTAEPIPLDQVKYEAYVTGVKTHGGYQAIMIYSKVPIGHKQEMKARVEGDFFVVEINEQQIEPGEYYQEHIAYGLKIYEQPQIYKVILNGKEVKQDRIGYGIE